jgi:uncharacterized protein (DUF4415 family)
MFDPKGTSRTDWDRLRTMTDFARARLVLPNPVQLDPEIVVWFKQQSQDYAERINEVLRQHIESQKRGIDS